MSKKITSFFSAVPRRREPNENLNEEVDASSCNSRGLGRNKNPDERNEAATEPETISANCSLDVSNPSSPDLSSDPKRPRLDVDATDIPAERSNSIQLDDDRSSVAGPSCNIDGGDAASLSLPALDIGKFIGSDKSIDGQTRFSLLTNPWKPPTGYKFPFSLHVKKSKEERRFLKQSHLDAYAGWAVFSEHLQGVLCKYCALFATLGSEGRTPLGTLVKTPLTNFSKVLGQDGAMESHQRSTYHKDAVADGEKFKDDFKKPGATVIDKLDSKRQTQIKENRERITPIIESIIFLGRQNFALRGHRDHGRIDVDEDESSDKEGSSYTKNEGNFRELLRFRVKSGDTTLRDHLEQAAENAKYTSAPVQNQIIECCGKILHGKIIAKAKAAIYYSIGFDETTDTSHKSQMTITIKFIDGKTSREDFLGFHDLHDMNCVL